MRTRGREGVILRTSYVNSPFDFCSSSNPGVSGGQHTDAVRPNLHKHSVWFIRDTV